MQVRVRTGNRSRPSPIITTTSADDATLTYNRELRVRAMVLESVVDHSVHTQKFLDTQAATAQDSFDEFVAWCNKRRVARSMDATWERSGRTFSPAERGELSGSAWELSFLVQRKYLPGPDYPGLAQRLVDLDGALTQTATRSNPMEIFCQDWNLLVRSHHEYAAHLRRIAPDMRYPGVLLATATCLGAPPADNPQQSGDPADQLTPRPGDRLQLGTNVKRQLGDRAVLLTYEGAGHGTYNSS